jgi:radical S-adenosyl methionine domain-containing protein 2
MIPVFVLQVAFKLNTVVNTFNKHEDMAAEVMKLNPVRWKVGAQIC